MGLITPSFLEESAEVEPQQSPPAVAQPAEPDRNTLMRAYRNLEFADTPQEREQIHASLVPSTERKMSPEVFSSFAERFDLGRHAPDAPSEILMSDEMFDSFAQKYGFAAPAPVLTQPVERTAPAAPVAEPVFKDESAIQKAVADVPRATQPFADVAPTSAPKTFGEHFSAARTRGEELFDYKGKSYTTELEEATGPLINTMQDRQNVRAQHRAGSYRQSILPVKSDPLSTVQALEEAGIVIDRKQLTPDIGEDIDNAMIPGAVAVKDALAELDLGDAIVTSGKREKGKHASFHEIGLGMDFSLRNVPKGKREELYTRLNDMLPGGFELDRNDMFPKKGSEIIPHIHIERDTAETKAAMRKAFKAGSK